MTDPHAPIPAPRPAAGPGPVVPDHWPSDASTTPETDGAGRWP